jgi:hypothetical protein
MFDTYFFKNYFSMVKSTGAAALLPLSCCFDVLATSGKLSTR